MSKKAKRGKRGKAKPTIPAPPRKTAFIASESGPERVFPCEIRNKIYRLLLTADNVQVHPRGNPQEIRVHRYRFRVNVLRANKAINEEAKEILFKENDFIVVSAKEQYFESNMNAFAVPIVTKSMARLEHFTEHVLEFRFMKAPETGDKRRCYCRDCLRPAQEMKYLLVDRDLDSFIRFCRTSNHLVHGGQFAVVHSPRDQPFEFFRQDEKPATTAITFRKTAYVTPSSAFVADVAAKLRRVVGARQVHISGAIDTSLALETQRAMMPRVVFGYAMGWDLVDLMASWKQYADEVAEDGNIRGHADGAAITLFSIIEQISSRSLVIKLGLEHGTLYAYSHTLCTEWFEACQYLRFDACLSMAIIALHLNGDVQKATQYVTEAAKCVLTTCHMPPESLSTMHHVMALMKAHEGKCSEALTHMQNAILEREMAGLTVDTDLECELKKHQAHVAKHNKRPGGEILDESCRKICCSKFQDQASTVKTPFHGTKPAGLVGWYDVYRKLAVNDLKAMGVNGSEVPARVNAQVTRPQCHLKVAAGAVPAS